MDSTRKTEKSKRNMELHEAGVTLARSAFLLSLLCSRLQGVNCLKLTNIDVPAHKQAGHDAKLLCEFEMEGDTLYSVKWYKDDLEFYRYVPNDNPKLQVFQQKGINVAREKSSRHLVVLRQVGLDSAGTYKCEVSAEAPSFRTKSAHQDMVVVVPPSKVEIHGMQPKYRVGDTVNVTCISYKSEPAASLVWRVNEEEVSSQFESFVDHDLHWNQKYRDDDWGDLRKSEEGRRGRGNGRNAYIASQPKPQLKADLHEFNPKVEDDGMETAQLGLSFVVQQRHVHSGLQLECTSSIGSVYWQSIQEKSPVGSREQPAVSGTWWTSSTGASEARSTPLGYALLLLVQLSTWLIPS